MHKNTQLVANSDAKSCKKWMKPQSIKYLSKEKKKEQVDPVASIPSLNAKLNPKTSFHISLCFRYEINLITQFQKAAILREGLLSPPNEEYQFLWVGGLFPKC